MSIARYWIAFGVGVSAGAAIALLYAPQTGEITREQLKRKLDDASSYLDGAGDYIKDSADKLGAHADRVVTSTRSTVKDVVDNVVDRASSVANTTVSKMT